MNKERYLLKYVACEAFADDLLSGKLYMNAAAYYWRKEKDKGDIREATISDTHQIYMNASSPIYCLYYVDDNDISDDCIRLKQRCIEELSCQVGWVVVINYEKFLERIPLIDFNGFYAKYGRVNYRQLNKSDMNYFLTQENSLNNLFYKHPKFSYQNEFRIACADRLEQNVHRGVLLPDGMVVDEIDKEKPYNAKIYHMNSDIYDIACKYYIPSIASNGLLIKIAEEVQ